MSKYDELVNQMTLEEKASLLSGKTSWETKPIERLGVYSVTMTDGPHGLRKEKPSAITNIMKPSEPSTCFPTAVTVACSWNKKLVAEMGAAIAEEALHYGVSTVLGPGVNIKRSPLCGRNFEYFSEDPFLAGELGTAYVKGVQATGVGTSLKHYAANSQEYMRMTIDSKVDERALREIYLAAFEKIVKEALPTTIMASYNRLNGEYLCDSRRMLTDILRKEWGFRGLVVSDWGAVNDRVQGVRAGLDLEMPANGGINDRNVVRAVNAGELSMLDLNKCASRVVEFAEHRHEVEETNKDYRCDFDAHHALARRVSSESSVLLKNNGALPLNTSEKLAVIGAFAETPRYQGSGSSKINPTSVPSFLSVLNRAKIKYTYAKGYTFDGDGYNEKLFNLALETAKYADKVLLFVGLTNSYESEGYDRTHMELPQSHIRLAEELTRTNRNVVVILMGGSPVELPFLKRTNALLNVYLGGQAVSEATFDILYGKVNPSGKLAETFPLKNNDCICHLHYPMGPKVVEHRESIFVGYRYFDTAGVPVQFPFGFGLSYTDFEYGNFRLEKTSIKEGEQLTASFTVKNIGDRDGAEIAELYVSDLEHTLFAPSKQLCGFEKVFLDAGEEKTIDIVIEPRAFQFYNVEEKDWCVESGEFSILLASSSAEIKQALNVYVQGSRPDMKIPDYTQSAPVYYDIKDAGDISQEQFGALFGGDLGNNEPYKRGEFDENCTILDVSTVKLGKHIRKLLHIGGKILMHGSENADMVEKSIDYIPLRGCCGFTGGILSQVSVFGLVDMLNGVKGGFKKFLSGFQKKNR